MTSLTEPDSSSTVALEMSGAAVLLEGVTVRYRIRFERHVTLKEYLLHWNRRRQTEDFTALHPLDLRVERGEVLGIIGANGAGKTTLLNVVGRIIDPSAGRLRIQGRTSALIDLMGGFHPDLTGRENVLLRTALLGIPRRQALERLPEIEEFADIGPFMEAPLRTWSAGMIARVAFSVATTVDADVLIVDEALGAGDAAFQRKCVRRIDAYREAGVTFLIVSHDLGRLLEMCDRIVWLEQGRIREIGAPHEVVRRYTAQQG